MLKIILFLMIVLTKFALLKGIAFTANQRYSYVGRSSIYIPSLILSKNNTNWHTTPATITIVFERAALFSNLNLIATIADLEMKNLNQGIQIFIDEYNVVQQTHFYMNIYAGNASNIVRLSVFYIYFQKDSSYLTNIQLYRIDYLFNYGYGIYLSNNNASTFTLTLTTTAQMNTTGGAKIITYISGMHMASIDDYFITYDVSSSGSIKNSTVIILVFTSKSTMPTLIYELYIRICVYNPQFVFSDSSNYYHLYSGTISEPYFSSGNLQMTSFNTIVGLTSFSLSYSSFFNFSILVDATGITIANLLNSFQFTYVTIYSNYCDYKTPYYESSVGQCWDKCPGSSLSDYSSLSCICYVDGVSVDMSKCAFGQSSSNGSSNSAPIIAAVISGVVLTITLIITSFICIRRYCQKVTSNEVKKQIYFQNYQKNNNQSMNAINTGEKGFKIKAQNAFKGQQQPEFEFKKDKEQNFKVQIQPPKFYPQIKNKQEQA